MYLLQVVSKEPQKEFQHNDENSFMCNDNEWINSTDSACDAPLTDAVKQSSFLFCSERRVPKYIWIPIGMYFDLHQRLDIDPIRG